MSGNENESAVSNLSTTDEVSRSSVNESQINETAHGSPLTETTSLTNEPADFSALKEDDIDEDVLETHPQNSILSTGADSSRKYIKRPLNAYMIWTRHARDGILKDNPHLKMNEVSKTMGEMWKKLPEENKKPFFVIARKSALKHKKALEKDPNLAYVPSRKKVKKGDKPDEASIKDEGSKSNQQRTSASPYPTPSASPHTPMTRSGFPHSSQTPQPPIEAPRPHQSAVFPPPAIVKPVNSSVAPFSSPVHATPLAQPYQPDYRSPGTLTAVSAQAPYSYGQSTPQIRYVTSAPLSQPAQPSFSDTNGQHVVYANAPPFQHAIPEQPAHFIPNPRDQGTYLVRNPYALPRTDLSEPIYEPETPEAYKELYYRSLVQLQLPSKYGQNDRETLTPEFYLQRYYALGGTDPPVHNPAKTSTNNSNGLVYQEL
ncbi:hypothetical protein M3Y94_00295000 [Aphelenchoides besseyi]|nr:hypothetical protein M3Y94_00295000 [Aphelenchoides besseyi]